MGLHRLLMLAYLGLTIAVLGLCIFPQTPERTGRRHAAALISALALSHRSGGRHLRLSSRSRNPWASDARARPQGDPSKALELAGVMSIQIIAVCACAGIIVGVISLTGVGARFSSVLLDLAAEPASGAVLRDVHRDPCSAWGCPRRRPMRLRPRWWRPGLIGLGIPTLTAHFFVFYFAVLSAITPPVALASYAAAGISGSNPMETSVASFKIGIAAFIVPFMFFYNSALLMDGTWFEVLRAG
jgi:TRAP-type uncharacterized transport system fused permease subunit